MHNVCTSRKHSLKIAKVKDEYNVVSAKYGDVKPVPR